VSQVIDIEKHQEDQSSIVIKCNLMLDGSDTLIQAADMARAYADFLEALDEDGYALSGTINNGLGVAVYCK